MLCPFCGFESSKVLESRSTSERTSIRRRRECENCQKRFTTYEKIELIPLLVIKKNGSREEYSRDKLINSVLKACNKCEVDVQTIQEIINNIELEISISGKKEVNTVFLGENILEFLKDLNEVAYIRYLSVFKEFKTINEFVNELNTLNKQATLV